MAHSDQNLADQNLADQNLDYLEKAEAEKAESARVGKLVLLWLVGFFIVFATVDALFVYIATKTHTGEVVSTAGPAAKSKPVFEKPE